MVNRTYTKKPVKTNKIHAEFSGGRLTNYGGIVPFGAFLLDKLAFREALAEQLDLGMGSNCSYGDWQVFEVIVFGYLCGYKRLAHFEQLSRDATVQQLLGLEGPIDENTLARRVKKVGQRLARVTQAMTRRVHGCEKPTRGRRQWIDCDSTLKGVYGHAEGAGKGFISGPKGPLLSSAAGF